MEWAGIAFVIKSKNIIIYLKSIINQKISLWLAFSTTLSRIVQLRQVFAAITVLHCLDRQSVQLSFYYLRLYFP